MFYSFALLTIVLLFTDTSFSRFNITVRRKMAPSNNSTGAVCFQFPNSYFDIDDNSAPYIVNAALNVPLAIITTVANALVLQAIYKAPSLHLPSKILLGNLALTDLTTGLVAQPSLVAFLISKIDSKLDASRCRSAMCFVLLGATVSCISLVNITAIALDRCAAFHFRLKYREIVTPRRVCASLVVAWSYAIVYASAWLWSMKWYSHLAIATYCTSFLVTSLAYISIHRGLRHQHRIQTHELQSHSGQDHSGPVEFNAAQYRRSALNMLWIYGLFILCYLPYLCIVTVRRLIGSSVLVQCILEFTVTIVFLNSFLNPFLYCYRLPEIRNSVLETLRKVCSKRRN